MIVEFIGSTGSGKTTLIREVQSRLEKQVRVRSAYDVVAAPLGLRRISNSSVRNLVQEFIGLPFFLGSLGRNRAFLAFALQMLRRGRASRSSPSTTCAALSARSACTRS